MPASLIYLAYHWLGFWIGYLRHLLPARARNRAVVGDRYAYEFQLDPERLRINLPSFIRALAAKTVPQPQLVICLTADKDVIMARKNELTADEINAYQNALVDYAMPKSRFSIIDANSNVESVVDEAKQLIAVAIRK